MNLPGSRSTESIRTPPSRWPCRGWLCSSKSIDPVGAARWPPVAVASVKPFIASSRTADPSSRKRIFASPAVASPAPVIGRGRVQPAQQVVALKLRVLGVNLNRLAAAPRRQLHRVVQHQEALLRVVGGAHRAARCPAPSRNPHAGGRRHSALLVEGQPAGLDVNLALLGGLGRRGQRFAPSASCRSPSCPASPWAQSPAPRPAASA